MSQRKPEDTVKLSPALDDACTDIMEAANHLFLSGELEMTNRLYIAVDTIRTCFSADKRKDKY